MRHLTDQWGTLTKEALRGGIPVEKLTYQERGVKGWIQRTSAPILGYRGFGTWKEMKSAHDTGIWRSGGAFTVRSYEGDVQMALDFNTVLRGSGFHGLRGTGFLGIVEADIRGLPFASMTASYDPAKPPWVESNSGGFVPSPGDPTKGVMYPDLGLGIGIITGIPAKNIRTIYEIENRRVIGQFTLEEGAEFDMVDNPDWSGAKKAIVNVPKKGAKTKMHILDQRQTNPVCGAKAATTGFDSMALIDPDDVFKRPEMIRNFWRGEGTTFSIRENQVCRICFEHLGSYKRAF